MKVLVIGSTGMLGYSIFCNLSDNAALNVYGTVRNIFGKEDFFTNFSEKLLYDVDVNDFESVVSAIKSNKPDVVINCVGLIKHQDASKNHIEAIYINSLLPHKIASVCDEIKAKLIHFSTDCVFSGVKGQYKESDIPDAHDLYGRTKCLGEVNYKKHLTLRTSIIGHELNTSISLVDWFLAQKDEVNGYSNAIFSGLPTCYVSKILNDWILPNKNLAGLYHLSVEPIDKYTLLKSIAEKYTHHIRVNDFKDFIIDRSLNSEKIKQEIDFITPKWSDLIEYMFLDYKNRYVRFKR